MAKIERIVASKPGVRNVISLVGFDFIMNANLTHATTMFVMLTVPGPVVRLPLWLTVVVISRDLAIVLTVAVVNLAVFAWLILALPGEMEQASASPSP